MVWLVVTEAHADVHMNRDRPSNLPAITLTPKKPVTLTRMHANTTQMVQGLLPAFNFHFILQIQHLAAPKHSPQVVATLITQVLVLCCVLVNLSQQLLQEHEMALFQRRRLLAFHLEQQLLHQQLQVVLGDATVRAVRAHNVCSERSIVLDQLVDGRKAAAAAKVIPYLFMHTKERSASCLNRGVHGYVHTWTSVTLAIASGTSCFSASQVY